MSIDLIDLGYDERLALNEQIIERLKLLDKLDACQAMHRFNLGSRVCFESSRHGLQVGTLVKFNQKTVVVLTDDGRRWKVSPQMLSPVVESDCATVSPRGAVIDIKKKSGDSENSFARKAITSENERLLSSERLYLTAQER